MSRSKRSVNGGSSDKYYKKKANRKMRRLLKEKFLNNESVKPNKRDFTDKYLFSKDGKHKK